MLKVKRETEEAQMKRDIDRLKWEKKEEAEAKARMLKLMEQDRIARFGKKASGESGKEIEAKKPTEPPEETIKKAVKTIE